MMAPACFTPFWATIFLDSRNPGLVDMIYLCSGKFISVHYISWFCIQLLNILLIEARRSVKACAIGTFISKELRIFRNEENQSDPAWFVMLPSFRYIYFERNAHSYDNFRTSTGVRSKYMFVYSVIYLTSSALAHRWIPGEVWCTLYVCRGFQATHTHVFLHSAEELSLASWDLAQQNRRFSYRRWPHEKSFV